jgi:hypothetical protein
MAFAADSAPAIMRQVVKVRAIQRLRFIATSYKKNHISMLDGCSKQVFDIAQAPGAAPSEPMVSIGRQRRRW